MIFLLVPKVLKQPHSMVQFARTHFWQIKICETFKRKINYINMTYYRGSRYYAQSYFLRIYRIYIKF